MDKTIERLAAVLDAGRIPDGAAGADMCAALDAESAYRSKYAAHEERRDLARRLLAALGLVGVDPALVERLHAAEAERARYKRDGCPDYDGDPAWDRRVYEEPRAQAIADAREDLLVSVLAQLGGGQ